MSVPPNTPDPRRPPRFAGGAPLALIILTGVIVGGLLGQPSIGLLVGVALGIAVALLIWRYDSRRR